VGGLARDLPSTGVASDHNAPGSDLCGSRWEIRKQTFTLWASGMAKSEAGSVSGDGYPGLSHQYGKLPASHVQHLTGGDVRSAVGMIGTDASWTTSRRPAAVNEPVSAGL